MQRRAILFVTVAVFALASSLAVAQGRGGGGNQSGGGGGGGGAYQGGGGGGAGGYHGTPSGGGYRGGYGGYYGGHYGYRSGYYGGWRGYGGWYGPGVGIYLGAPWYWGAWGVGAYPYYPYAGYGGYPAYVAPAPAYVGEWQNYTQPMESQSYVQQQPAPSAYWYYCADPAGYYPYIPRCQAGWTRVTPQNVPPGQ